jgi:hypothetical protein
MIYDAIVQIPHYTVASFFSMLSYLSSPIDVQIDNIAQFNLSPLKHGLIKHDTV